LWVQIEFPQLLVAGQARQLFLTYTLVRLLLDPTLEDNICSRYFTKSASKSNNYIFRVFRVSFILIYSAPFSLSSSLRAGLSKRTQKPLGAHQERILIAMKENTAVLIYRPNYEPFIAFPELENLTSSDSLHQCIVSSFALFHSYHLLAHYFAPRKMKNLAPKYRTNSYLRKQRNPKM
jgi:hypothetical protein